MRLWIPLFSLACTPQASEEELAPNPKDELSLFIRDEGVQVTEPSNGAVVGAPFEVLFTVGEDVAGVRLFADGFFVGGLDNVSDNGKIEATLDSGTHKLTLVGLGAGDVPVSEHSLTVQVVIDEDIPWVMITSPADEGTPTNPVRFTVSASGDVDTIELQADGWTLGEISTDEVLTYEFSGTGFSREIEALAYDDGELMATDSIEITVQTGTAPSESDFTALVAEILQTYPTDGSYSYYWPSGSDWGGNPTDIFYLSEIFAEGDDLNRSFCVGLTFEVFMQAFEEIDREVGGDGRINGVPFDELFEFRTDWYVRDLYGTGIVEAMQNYGIGELVTNLDDVREGDIVQFWRHSGSGHNVIFIDWVTDSTGTRTGFEYWGTQGSTDGIGYSTESFGASGSAVDPSFFFPGRLWMPEDWKAW